MSQKSVGALYESQIGELNLMSKGKVRDNYAIDQDYMLMVTTDRLSAFDCILPNPIPGKGEVLTRMSNFWKTRMEHIIHNDLTSLLPKDVVKNREDLEELGDRAVVVKKVQPLMVEAIVRGYLIGSGWKDYQLTGSVCGIELPEGLLMAGQLPEAIYTPSTKADAGMHDENIDFAATVDILGQELAEQVRDVSLRIYTEGAAYARERGIIIADTKFEFGIDGDGKLVLIDEVLTADSSRFWPADQYRPGTSPPSFDKQFVRDYLETLDWDKRPPAPPLPLEIIEVTTQKYLEAERRLTT